MTGIAYNGQVNCGIRVTNLDRSIEWYDRVLGFRLRERIDAIDFAILNTSVPGVVLGLSVGDAARTDAPTLTWGVEDIEAARAALDADGVLMETLRDIPGVVRLQEFFDPDGNPHTFWAEPVA